MSQTKDEQFLDSEGPPPLAVPRKVTVIWDISQENPNTPFLIMQMPNVFVVPPEEDQSPAWCFFDAAHPTLSQIIDRPETPDIHVFSFPDSNDPSPFGKELPVFVDPLIAPRNNSSETRSIVDALEDENEDNIYHDIDTDSEYDQDTELEGALSSVHNEPFRTLRDTSNDSDVIEVVKVRRSRHSSPKEDDGPQNVGLTSEFKRSKTLKSRASKAFRSLKGSLRTSKPRAQDLFASAKSNSHHHSDIVTATMPGASPRPPTPSVSRRGSRILSHLFISPSLRSRSSISSLDEPTLVSRSEPAFFALTSSPTQSSFVSASSATDRLSCRSSIYENELLQDEARLKAASPTPTATTDFKKTKSRRFSILSLHKLFSFSSPASSTPSSPISLTFDDSNCTPTLRSTSCTPSSVTSVCTTSGPQTPTNMEDGLPISPLSRGQDTGPASFASILDSDVVLNLGLGLSLDNFCARSSSDEHTPRARRTFRSSTSSQESRISNSKRQEKATPCPPPTSGPGVFQHEPGDLSFEMRLDSLHFDSLSFDADHFFTTN
ncbi:hypothetical protein BYT27DRAFT_7340796 [Phlegmacium glaucopus]|nr:hypothetical protein BYT27DRAFT_7340796 [Phlegmacium glaucopus]